MSTILHYEDFAVGQVHPLGTHTLTKDEMIAYAREFDSQPQHLDEDAARHSLLGGLAASGWFLGALAMRMIVQATPDMEGGMVGRAVENISWPHPVRPDDALDRTARDRGNSVYFPDRVVPMLPEALSNELCSLPPDEDRACMALHLWLAAHGNPRRTRS